MPSDALDVAIVASWYPTPGDPGKGRFVADQAAALLASGEVRPVVISFDPAMLIGPAAFRTRLADAVQDTAAAAIATAPDVFFAGLGASTVPVARLPCAEGRTGRDPRLHGLVHRSAPLAALAERWSIGDQGLPPHPRLIHAHTGYPDGAAAAGMARRLGVPLVITEHTTFLARLLRFPEIRQAYLTAGRQAARIVAVSAALAAEIEAALPELAERVVVVPNAIAVDDFRAAPLAHRRPDELLFVGYRREIKGIDVLLEAVAIARRSRPVTLRLIGGSGDEATERRWQALATRLGIAGAVAFEPSAERTGVAAAMARASLFVHASRRETFGVVAAEALATGTPVVATTDPALAEVLGADPDALGALVPVGDAQALAAAILRTLQRRTDFDPDRLRRSVVERYGAPAVAARLVELYRSVLAEQDEARPQRTPRRRAVLAPPQRVENPIWLVVALDPERARQAIASLRRRDRVVLVTSSGGRAAQTAGLAAVVVADLRGRVRATADASALAPRSSGWRRAVALARHPLAAARRRGWLPGLGRLLELRGAAALADGLDEARRLGGSDGSRLVCADGVDYLVASLSPTTGSAPGGTVWLAVRQMDPGR